MRIRLADIHAAAPLKPAGYVQDVLGAGRIEGEDLVIGRTAYLALCARYRQAGDAVAMAAQPVAKFLNVENCAGCNKRGERLNGGAPLLKPKP